MTPSNYEDLILDPDGWINNPSGSKLTSESLEALLRVIEEDLLTESDTIKIDPV